MEWVQVAVDIVSNLGFPIACVGAMFWLLNKERESHKEETDKFTEAINNNTKVMEGVKTIVETLCK